MEAPLALARSSSENSLVKTPPTSENTTGNPAPKADHPDKASTRKPANHRQSEALPRRPSGNTGIIRIALMDFTCTLRPPSFGHCRTIGKSNRPPVQGGTVSWTEDPRETL